MGCPEQTVWSEIQAVLLGPVHRDPELDVLLDPTIHLSTQIEVGRC